MAAILHTELPKNEPGFYGEYIFAKSIYENSNDSSELWFRISNLPNVPDIDVVLLHPKFGFFVIEVKGDNINQILNYHDGEYDQPSSPVLPMGKRQKPLNQVRVASHSLKNYFETHKVQSVWIQQAVAFPNVFREQWLNRYGESHPTNLFIFKDDLEDWEKFKSRLEALNKVPLIGKAQSMGIMTNSRQLKIAKSILLGDFSKIHATDEEREAILRPKDNFRQRASRYADVLGGVIEVKGKAGTGKTLFLMEWLMQRAALGENVLLVTFNKCLASELRRSLYAIRPINSSSKGSVSVYDIYDLRQSVIGSKDITDYKLSNNPFDNKWLSLYQMNEVTYPQFDAIAIDEAQDFSDLYYPLLERVSSNTAPWMVSRGTGQELYARHEVWPPDALKRRLKEEALVQTIQLKRSFRNARNLAILAMAFDEKYPNLEAAVKWANTKISDTDDGVDLFNEVKERSRLYFQNWTNNNLATELVFEPFLERAYRGNANARPLVLFPTTTHPAYFSALEYLNKVGHTYIDYVIRENRRIIAQPGEVRLSTFHSARGIESEDVLVFGLEELGESDEIEEKSEFPPRNLAYVALTRQTRDLTLAIDSTAEAFQGNTPSSLTFIRNLYHALRQ